MKKKLFLLLTMAILFISGCKEEISREYENVEVEITYAHYEPSQSSVSYINKTPVINNKPAEYEITVKYDGVIWTFDDEDTYNNFKDKVDEKVHGTLEIIKYDDGSIDRKITRLD